MTPKKQGVFYSIWIGLKPVLVLDDPEKNVYFLLNLGQIVRVKTFLHLLNTHNRWLQSSYISIKRFKQKPVMTMMIAPTIYVYSIHTALKQRQQSKPERPSLIVLKFVIGKII